MDLSMTRLERTGGRPLYQQIEAVLRERIVDGSVAPGEELPTERELAEDLGVSTFTCKRAFDALAADGLIDRGRGKRTRVSLNAGAVDFGESLEGMVETVLLESWNIEIELLEFGYVAAPAPVADNLRLDPGARVFSTVNLGYRRGQLIGHATTFVPEDLGGMFSREELADAPRFVLVLRTGRIRVDRAEQTLCACPMPPGAAARLGVAAGSPAFRQVRTLFDDAGRPIEYFEALFPHDRFSYHLSLTNRSRR